jgi:uncharacterized protein (DUF2126 family)/transglutaminase-like putative cysteine protease
VIRVKLSHLTEYTYDRLVSLSPHVVRLRPAPHTRTHIESYSLQVQPRKQFLNWQQDPFANWQARLVFPEKAKKLSVKVELVAHINVFNPFDFFVDDSASKFPFQYDAKLRSELAPYLAVSEDSPPLKGFVAGYTEKTDTIVDFLVSINRYVRDAVDYVIRLEPGVQTAAETLTKASGSCRDSAYLLVQLLRHLGLAARFVSGYLIQLKADPGAVLPEDGLKGPETDFTDLHAWAEVFIPGAGWVGLDATSGLMTAEGHIPLAATPEPDSAAAILGFTEPCESKLKFSMEVIRLSETPRVTKPYTDETWSDIIKLGKKLDRDLVKADLRLSIGGEPTFVSASDRESRQWNYDALGKEKYEYSEKLLERLFGLYCKGGIILRSQGKWYPGEPLPRWSLDAFWRRDGKPLWQDITLLGFGENQSGRWYEEKDALAFTTALTQKLDLPPDCIHPGYEDPAHYLLAESKLPPEFKKEITGNSFNEIERRRLLRILDAGLGEPAGYAVPLQFDSTQKIWESAMLEFRRGFLSLIPGDSPMGLRLPLDSIAEAYEVEHLHDPMGISKDEIGKVKTQARIRKKPVKKFFCCEARHGNLCLFMPPLPSLDEFITLIGLIEEVAAQLSVSVHLEGYEPPKDNRLNSFRITPDPGVIEVNIFPSASVAELIQKTETVYNFAENVGLTTDRYMLDGRPCATGGGNHITLGSLHPEDSPFLRRPDLLPSVVAFWQNHPSLSYLFSGMFIGPTSQAPRIDEARDGALYEAEIALKELRKHRDAPPWQIDRIMRNILVDMTGNTHRAEISIDKLFAPGSFTGRLGLVELRAFEMPPHYKMSVTQQLMVVALILAFWKEPYAQQLTPWGPALRDKWLMPFYLQQDFREVLRYLSGAGYKFSEALFVPFFEFRFPLYGTYRYEGIEFDLRMALEPWNVLGEETLSGNISRSVDSSVERVQLSVRNLDQTQFAVTCNGYLVPFHHDAAENLCVGAVVFKAWAPPFSLHPTIGVHAPLNFSIYDKKRRKYVAGFSYHVSHPGGRSYDTFPVNSYEAESRRLSRFQEQAEYPSKPPESLYTDEYPHTLDLRLA